LTLDPKAKLVSIKPVFTSNELDSTEPLSIKLVNAYNCPANRYREYSGGITFQVNLHLLTALLKMEKFSGGCWLRAPATYFDEGVYAAQETENIQDINKAMQLPYLALTSGNYSAYFSETYS
jgi:hypothetical protein